jgi:hypothetical protein
MSNIQLTAAVATAVAITALSIGSPQARSLHPMPGRTIATGKIDSKAPLPPINPFKPIRAVTTGMKTLRAV